MRKDVASGAPWAIPGEGRVLPGKDTRFDPAAFAAFILSSSS